MASQAARICLVAALELKVVVAVSVNVALVVAILAPRGASLGPLRGAERGGKDGPRRECGVADEFEELVRLLAQEFGRDSKLVRLCCLTENKLERPGVEGEGQRRLTGWLLYRRQLDQMRSRSSAKAFLLLYICDLTRFCSVARSIGFLITARAKRVSAGRSQL